MAMAEQSANGKCRPPENETHVSSTITEILERFTLDGPLGSSPAVAAGLALVTLFALALWRERRVLGLRTTVLFWLLRSVALATVIWMLLAPTRVRVETSTTRKIVAVAVDVSGSMRTVDPPGTADELRWVISTVAADNEGVTQATDKAFVDVGIAQRQLLAAVDALRRHRPESAVVEATSSANHALKRAKSHLQQVRNAGKSAELSPETAALAVRLGDMLDGPEFEAFEQLGAALEKGRTPSQKGWRESLPDLEQRVAGIRRRLGELARRVAEEESRRIALRNPERLASISQAPRLGRITALLNQLHPSTLAAVGEQADVRWISFDQTVAAIADSRLPQGLAALGKVDAPDRAAAGTDLSAVLEQLHRARQDQPLAAVILLSDMAHNQTAGRNPRDAAAALAGAPVHVVPIGNTQHVRDVLVQSVSAPTVAMRNDAIVIEVRVQAYDCEGEVCVVQLLHEGAVIDFREVQLDSGLVSRTVRFERLMPAVGSQRFQVAATPLDGELTEDNNYGEFEVNVTRSDIKVLLADELPRWEYRYLTQLFRRDPKVECDELLFHPRMVATGRREASRTFPATVDEWDQYDVVVLGDLSPEHLPVAAQEALIEYLQQRGGALVLIAGREAMPQAYESHPLEQVLPVSPIAVADAAPVGAAGYAFRVTEEGRQHDALMIGETDEATRAAWDFVNRVAPLHEVSAWRRPRPTAHTLIAAAPRDGSDENADAFLCWQPVGRGRVVYLAGPETYRLRFLRGDRLHYRFWGQLLRWVVASDLAAGAKFVRIRTDKSRYDSGETVQATVYLKDAQDEPVTADGLQVRLTAGDDERTAPLTPVAEAPGEYRAEIPSLPAGVYRIEPLGPAVEQLQTKAPEEPASAGFTVQAELPQELVDTRADRALAQHIADITGGQVAPPTAVAEILELTNLEPIVTERTERRPLWVQWKYLWLVFGCLQMEWVIRKWRGLS